MHASKYIILKIILDFKGISSMLNKFSLTDMFTIFVLFYKIQYFSQICE